MNFNFFCTKTDFINYLRVTKTQQERDIKKASCHLLMFTRPLRRVSAEGTGPQAQPQHSSKKQQLTDQEISFQLLQVTG